jgi:hypothetical protein
MSNNLFDVRAFFKSSDDELSDHWVTQAYQYNQLLFGNHSSANIDINQVIQDFRAVFDNMYD